MNEDKKREELVNASRPEWGVHLTTTLAAPVGAAILTTKTGKGMAEK